MWRVLQSPGRYRDTSSPLDRTRIQDDDAQVAHLGPGARLSPTLSPSFGTLRHPGCRRLSFGAAVSPPEFPVRPGGVAERRGPDHRRIAERVATFDGPGPAPARRDGAPLVIGGGPAGLAAALELTRRGYAATVVERGARMGGLARTEVRDGYRFDLGGHRFYTKVPRIAELWREMLGADFLTRPRLSRIYYRDRFFRYPLELLDVLAGLGPVESLRAVLSFGAQKLMPKKEPVSFEDWVVQAFGRRLFETFFESYTEKVWGIPCSRISAEWAAQRIRGLTLQRAVLDAVGLRKGTRSLVREFHYPRLGPGMMWERFAEAVAEGGGVVRRETEAVEIRIDEGRVREVLLASEGGEETVRPGHVVSSMALRDLIAGIRPAPPAPVTEAAAALHYRAFLIVVLIVEEEDLFPDNWIYIHEPGLRVARIQNFGRWSEELVPEEGTSSIGLEYFCEEGDDLWCASDDALAELALREFRRLGFAHGAGVRTVHVLRQPDAYPVYDEGYTDHLRIIREWLGRVPNLLTVGRNGMHRYNNMDHSMLTGLLAARVIDGEPHDIWALSTERSYYETFEVPG